MGKLLREKLLSQKICFLIKLVSQDPGFFN